MTQANRENSPPEPADPGSDGMQVSLSILLKSGVAEVDGKPCGRVADVIVHLRRNDYAHVTGVIIDDGGARTFVLADSIIGIRANVVDLKSETWGVKPVAIGSDEVSLKSDVLCQRVIDISRSALVKAYDVRLAKREGGWAAVALDVHRARWLALGSHAAHPAKDWRGFLPLVSVSGLPAAHSSPNWIGRLKAAQIADLIEAATAAEQDKLLGQVHSDPELEADVFEELEDDRQARVFKSRTDAEVAEVLSRMRADDAADAVMELARERRETVLGLLPEMERTKIMTLLGYNEATAGGLMGTEFLALSQETTVGAALNGVRNSSAHQPEALVTIHALDSDGKLVGTLGLVQAVQADPAVALREAADRNLVTASPEDDISTVITRMADFNLLSLPVVDGRGVLIGIVTVDDALEAALPTHWTTR